MTLVANLLMGAGAAFTLPFLFSQKGWGPEGPVGAFVGTVPVALLQTGALYLCVQAGAFDWAPGGRALLYALLLGYFLVMSGLPIAAVGSQAPAIAAKVAGVLVMLAAFAALNLQTQMQTSLATRAAVGSVLGVAGFAGWLIIGAMLLEGALNSIRKIQQDAEREDQWLVERKAWEQSEWDKVGSNAALWQLIQYTHAHNGEVRKECRARIAALPGLENDMIALLETGWAEHSLSYLRDAYPLPYRNLSAAYARFLEKQLLSWQSRLMGDDHADKWEPNLHPLFDVAEKIVQDGGDLRPQLASWLAMLKQVKGLGPVIGHVHAAQRLHLVNAH